MGWRDIWQGTTSSGRKVAVQEDDDGDIRVSTTTKDDADPTILSGDGQFGLVDPMPAGTPIIIEPDDGESLEDALITQGGFTAEEAASIASHVEDRS